MGNGQWAEGEEESHFGLVGFEESDKRPIVDFRDLAVWKEAMEVAELMYRDTADFPRAELYGLISQIRRAAVSIPSNIAEGYGRQSTGAYLQFLKVAQGSAKELETLIELARRLGYLKAESAVKNAASLVRVSKMLNGLIRAIEQKRT